MSIARQLFYSLADTPVDNRAPVAGLGQRINACRQVVFQLFGNVVRSQRPETALSRNPISIAQAVNPKPVYQLAQMFWAKNVVGAVVNAGAVKNAFAKGAFWLVGWFSTDTIISNSGNRGVNQPPNHSLEGGLGGTFLWGYLRQCVIRPMRFSTRLHLRCPL